MSLWELWTRWERGSTSLGLWAHTCAWGAHSVLLIPSPPLGPGSLLLFVFFPLSQVVDLKWKTSEPVLYLPFKATCALLNLYTVSRPVSEYLWLELHLCAYVCLFKYNAQICTDLHRQVHMCTLKYIPWKALFVYTVQSHHGILYIYSSNWFCCMNPKW